MTESATQKVEAQAQGASAELRPILIVEDRELHAYLLEKGLHRAGIRNKVLHYTCLAELKDYLEGAKKWTEALPGVLFLDINLKDENGLKVLAWMKDRLLLEKIFTVIISGMNEVEVVKKAFALGAHFFLGKPVDYNDLQTLIQNHRGRFE